MTLYCFTGRVLPERANVSPPELARMQVDVRELGWTSEAEVSIVASQISVVFVGSEPVEDLRTLKNAAQNLCQMVADVLCYGWGYAYTIEIVSLTVDGRDHEVFGVELGAIERSRDERPLQPGDQLYSMALQTPALWRALSDLRRAVREPIDTAFHAYRAIECLRQHFDVGGGPKRRPGKRCVRP